MFHRTGPFLEEATALKSAAIQRLIDQYTELRDALARVGNRAYEYDICLYKVADLTTRHMMSQMKNVSRAEFYGAVFLVVCCLAFLFFPLIPFIALLPMATLLIALCVGGSEFPKWVSYWFRLSLKYGLDYGVRFRYPLRASLAIITVFALAYTVTTYMSAGRSDLEVAAGSLVVADGGATTIAGDLWPKPPDIAEVHMVCGVDCARLTSAVGNSFYFSTVTFTTLGYGDMQPRGRLKFYAALEAMSGAVMIAMLTVIFARRYLRL